MDRASFCDILPDNVKEEMAKAHKSSLLMLNEVGFMLCERNGHVVSGYWCSGEECRISREQVHGCPPETEPIGFFHSHLTDKPEPSIGDLLYAYDIGIDHLCISGREDSKFVVACYDLYSVRDELAELSELIDEIRELVEENYDEAVIRMSELESLEDEIIRNLKSNACEFEIEVL